MLVVCRSYYNFPLVRRDADLSVQNSIEWFYLISWQARSLRSLSRIYGGEDVRQKRYCVYSMRERCTTGSFRANGASYSNLFYLKKTTF